MNQCAAAGSDVADSPERAAILVSLATPGRVPPHTARTMVRLHTPEDLALDRE